MTATGYAGTADLSRVAKAGDTMTGTLVLAGTVPMQVPAGSGAGKVWTSDAQGDGSWQTPTGGVSLDTNAAHFKAVELAGAGSIGLAADSGHSHPLRAWQFDVTAYGAKPDGRFVYDGQMTANSNVLTCPNTAPFTSGDTVKNVIVSRVGPNGVTSLVCPVSAYTSPTSLVLAANASVTASGCVVFWGTDNTTAFTSAETAATTYAQQNAFGVAAITGPPGLYGIFGALNTSLAGNAQIPLHIPATSANKITLFIEPLDLAYAATGAHWQQTVPQATGMTLVSGGVFANATAQANSLTAAGNPCVIGGPAQPGGYGTSPNLKFSNMNLVMRGVTVITPLSASGWNYCGIDLSGLSQCTLRDVNIGVTGTYVGGDFGNTNTFSAGLSKGLILPANGNNDIVDVANLSVWGGYTWGAFVTEHTVGRNWRLLYCWSAMAVIGNYFNSAGAGHAAVIDQCSVEGCVYNGYILGQGAAGIGPYIDILQMDTESPAPRWRDGNDGALATAQGMIRITGLYTAGSIQTDANTSLKILNGQQTQGPVPALAYSLGTPFQNTYWQPVRVTLGGGNVTAVKVSSLMGGPGGGGVPALTNMAPAASGGGALPVQTFDLGPGAWMEIDGSVKPTTNVWAVAAV
jgi:hypothetical protein